jgi:diguanylate cyclase (GGDEF)-like protein/PAS domain S-box-containing protein
MTLLLPHAKVRGGTKNARRSPAAIEPLPGPAVAGAPAAQASESAAGPVRVLVLEDVASDADLEIRALQNAGINVIARRAEARQEFTQALDEFMPDVVLADYNLPQFDGLAAIELVRKRSPDLPVILVTGVLGDEAAVQLIKAGVTDYILKDRLARLAPAVQRALWEAAEIRRRRLAEAARDGLARIVESARCAIIGTDLDGTVISWNSGAETIHGYTASEIVGTKIATLAPPELRAETEELIGKVVRGEEVSSFETERVTKSGKRVSLSLTMSPIWSHAHAVIGVSSIAHDITARRVAERALRQEQAFTDAIIQGLPGTFYVLDRNGRHLRWNEAERAAAGLPPERMGQSTLLELIHSEDRKEVVRRIDEVFETGQATAEARLVDARGEIRHVLLSARRLDIGGEHYLVGHGLDITERKHATNQLHALALYTRNLIEAGLDPLFVMNPDAKITDVNEATVRATGVPRARLIGSDFADYFTEPEKARVGCEETFAKGVVSNYPLALRGSSGVITDVLYNASVYRNASGTVVGIVAAAHDVTAGKRREEELARLHERLLAIVGELRQRERDTGLIDRLNEILQTCSSRDEAYPLIALTGGQLFEGSAGALAVLVEPARQFRTVAQWGERPTLSAEFSLQDCWGLRRGQMHELEAPGKGATCRHFERAPDSPYLCLPLSVQGEALGLLHIGAPAGAPIGEHMRRLAGTFGEVVKLSLSNLKLREALREQAIHDHLTGLYNRQYLDEMLQREILRAQRHKAPMSLVMIDIDNFKAFNDTYGHDAGDLVLQELAKLLRSSVRASDVVCRYGGEEFVLVLPDANADGAAARFSQIRQQIGRLRLTFRGQALPTLTVSAGMAQFPGHAASAEDIVTAADHALYAAKSAGRDCLRVFDRMAERAALALAVGGAR